MHIAIIMDGNGRWASSRGLPRLRGHAAGVRSLTAIVRGCPSLGIDSVTLFAFAIANWKRDKEEVDGLWNIFHEYIQKDLRELMAENVRVVVIGDRKGLPQEVQETIGKIEEDSKSHTSLLLQIALNYDGVDEVARMVERTIRAGVSADAINERYVLNNLDTEEGSIPDIVIRTGMPEPKDGMSIWRGSSFLPLQSVQSVCVSTPVLWPDFSVGDLEKIIAYAKPEERLFGGQRLVTSLKEL